MRLIILCVFSIFLLIANAGAEQDASLKQLSKTIKDNVVTHIMEVAPAVNGASNYHYIHVDKMPGYVSNSLSAKYIDNEDGKISVFVPCYKVDQKGNLNDFDLLIVMPTLTTQTKISFTYQLKKNQHTSPTFELEPTQRLTEDDEEAIRFGPGIKF